MKYHLCYFWQIFESFLVKLMIKIFLSTWGIFWFSHLFKIQCLGSCDPVWRKITSTRRFFLKLEFAVTEVRGMSFTWMRIVLWYFGVFFLLNFICGFCSSLKSFMEMGCHSRKKFRNRVKLFGNTGRICSYKSHWCSGIAESSTCSLSALNDVQVRWENR